MAFDRVTYVDGVTVITAKNLNDIQGEVLGKPDLSSTATDIKANGTQSAGSSTKAAKADHVHPTDTSRAPTSHASTATSYGVGNASNYGHLKLTDTVGTSGATGGTAATPAMVKSVNDKVGNGQLTDFTATDLTGAANELKGSLNSKILRVTGTISSSTLYVTNASVTTDMVPISCEFGTPANVLSNYSINTNTAGRITFTGITLSGSTTVDVILGIPKS